MVDDVDEVGEVEFGEEVDLYFECLLFAGAWEINFEGVELVVFAAKVDAACGRVYLACPPSPRRR